MDNWKTKTQAILNLKSEEKLTPIFDKIMWQVNSLKWAVWIGNYRHTKLVGEISVFLHRMVMINNIYS